jgi:tetratricopeptide (TPR) repeat protein
VAYEASGQLDMAVPLLEQTLGKQKTRLGPDHPDTLTSMSNLAVAYEASGQLDMAVPLLEQTLGKQKTRLGPDHPDTLTCMNNLAEMYWQLERLDQSIPLFEETLRWQEKKLGRQHPSTLMTVANLGVNYRDAGRLGEAIPLLEEAHAAAKKHARLRWVGAELLDGYVKAGKGTEAAKLLTDLREQLPQEGPELAGHLARFGLSLLQAKAFAEAEPLLRECLAIREKTQPDAWTTFNTLSLLGGALSGQKKYIEAEPLLLKGYQGMKDREKAIPQAGGKLRIPEALDRLIELYTATGQPEEAKQYRDLRAKYPIPREATPLPREPR